MITEAQRLLRNAKARKYRAENQAKIRAIKKKSRIKHRDSIKEYDKRRLMENRDKLLSQMKAWHSLNKDKANSRRRTWTKNNLETTKAYAAAYRKYKPWVISAATSRRRSAKLQATPPWLTKDHLEKIKQIYKQCLKGYHVDHIIPLQGKEVCGLHVPWNLQILEASENIRKGNKLCHVILSE